MYCNNCGNEIDDKAVYCSACGNKVGRTTTNSKLIMGICLVGVAIIVFLGVAYMINRSKERDEKGDERELDNIELDNIELDNIEWYQDKCYKGTKCGGIFYVDKVGNDLKFYLDMVLCQVLAQNKMRSSAS